MKKKGRKPNSYYENLAKNDISNNSIVNEDKSLDISNNKIPKKRGRKPKGGKIIEVKKDITYIKKCPNIILHLNCYLKDLLNNETIYNPEINLIENFNIEENKLNYDYISDDNENISKNNTQANKNKQKKSDLLIITNTKIQKKVEISF